jgi:hypothetical protein
MVSFRDELRARLADHHRFFLDQIETRIDEWITRHAEYADLAREAAKKLVNTGHSSAEVLILSQAANLAASTLGLSEAFVDLANADRVHAGSPVVRGLHETCCVPCYMAREVIPRLRKGRVNDVRRMLYRLGLGTGPGAGYGRVRPIGVESLNKSANAWIKDYLAAHDRGEVAAQLIDKMVYGPLSDRTHPNFGATHIAMTIGDDALPVFTLRPLYDEGNIDELLSAMFLMLTVAAEALERSSTLLRNIRWSFLQASHSGVTMTSGPQETSLARRPMHSPSRTGADDVRA